MSQMKHCQEGERICIVQGLAQKMPATTGRVVTIALAFIMCTAAARAAEFRILPAKANFKLKGIGSAVLETLGGNRITCLSVTGSGGVTSELLGEVEFKFVDCLDQFGNKCTGLNDGVTGEILFKVPFHMKHLLPASEGVAIEILVEHVHFKCGALILVLVLGNVCSDDILTHSGGLSAVNLLLTSAYINFLINGAGDPKVTELDTENGLGMEKCELKANVAGVEEGMALKLEVTIEMCEPNQCTFLIDLSGTL